MRHLPTTVFLAAAALCLGAASAAAQIDYRNLDEGHPSHTEDAYPVERYAFELLGGASVEALPGAGHAFRTGPELEYGLFTNGQVGISLPFADVGGSGTSTFGLAGLRLHALYSFNTERPSLPALALRTDLALPVGALAGDVARVTLTGIATRSWGLTRAHVNAAWSLGSETGLAAAGASPRWAASLAVDRTVFRSSLLLLAEGVVAQPLRGAPTEVVLSAGGRWQWTPTTVLDLGLSRRVGTAGPDIGLTVGLSHAFAFRGLMPAGPPRGGPGGGRIAPAAAGRPGRGSGRDEQFYYPGGFNWRFLARYPDAARLFNAFDYGHAILSETLLTERGADADHALDEAFRYLVEDLLVRPPRFAVPEEAIMPRYAKLAWRAKLMFDWAHVLHRQIYDAYADDRLSMAAKDSLIERITDYYLSRADYAFSAEPKVMELMDGQPFSQVFRRAHPRFNGLIWAYHWLQVGLYEPLVVYQTEADRRAGVAATVARFRRMLVDPPAGMPEIMPMTAAVAPEFARRHPRAAAIFDNLHMMHDIVSDLLMTDTVAAGAGRAAIDAQLDEFQDSTRNVVPPEHRAMMGEMMGGVDRMGGTGVGPWR